MKSFRQFILETPWINPDIDNEKEDGQRQDKVRLKKDSKHIVSRMNNGYIITKQHHPHMNEFVNYRVYEPKSKKPVFSVTGNEEGNKLFVSHLTGFTGHNSNLRAHEFYHHLITKHNIHLHSDFEQSEGGMKVWKALQKMPGIHMQSFNMSSEQYSELKPSFQRTYDMDSSTRLAAKKKE